MTAALTPPLKWHGGKHYLAPKIVALMPPHTHYVEPYAGGLSVLLAKDPEGVSEVVNDIDSDLMRFWRMLAHSKNFEAFRRFAEATPFSEAGWRSAGNVLDGLGGGSTGVGPETIRAWAFFVHCRQSLAGRRKGFATLSRTRVRRGMNEQASAWLSAVEGLPAVHARLKRVVMLDRDALEVIRSQDGPQTLFYLDPPYYPDTRSSPDTYGPCEMRAQDHTDLLDLVTNGGLKAKVMISGYRCGPYDTFLADWARHDFDLPNNAAGGESKRRMVESVWCNF